MTELALTLDQRHLMESLGLGLMVLSISFRLLSLWLNKGSGQPRLPLAKPAMLLSMLLGVALLLLTILAPPSGPEAIPPKPVTVQPPLPLPASKAVEAAPVPEPLPRPLPTQEPVSRPEPPAMVAATPSAPKPVARPSDPPKPESTVAAHPPQTKPTVAPKAVKQPEVKPERPKDAHKANIFSARCSRLLEKVGSGEPMSNAEQQEMVTKCQ